MNPLINSLLVRAADVPPIKPAVDLGTPLLLTIAAIGIAILLVMIIRFKIQAFVALLTVSILVAVASTIPLKDVFTVVANRRRRHHGQGRPADRPRRDPRPHDRGFRRRAVAR